MTHSKEKIQKAITGLYSTINKLKPYPTSQTIKRDIFEIDWRNPFQYLDSLYYTSCLSLVYQTMQRDLDEYKLKHPNNKRNEEIQQRVDDLRKVYCWIKKQEHQAEIIKELLLEWRHISSGLMRENLLLREENDKLNKMLDAIK